MKKLLLLSAAAALFTTGCGRQWSDSFGCGDAPTYAGYGGCCESSCCENGGMVYGGGYGGGYGPAPGFTTGYPAMPTPVLPGPELVPAPAR